MYVSNEMLSGIRRLRFVPQMLLFLQVKFSRFGRFSIRPRCFDAKLLNSARLVSR